jgi:hypothetical protein
MAARFLKSAVLFSRDARTLEEGTKYRDGRLDLVVGSKAGRLVKRELSITSEKEGLIDDVGHRFSCSDGSVFCGGYSLRSRLRTAAIGARK